MSLPLKAKVDYYKNFLSAEESHSLFQYLMNVPKIAELNQKKEHEKYFVKRAGKIIYMDEDIHASNKLPEEIWGETAVWPAEVLKIKTKIEQETKMTFQVCVCVYYPDGEVGITYHSDLPAYGDTSIIPSLSLGEERVFLIREIGQSEEMEILLEDGSLLIMGEKCQDLYEHSLPTNSKYKNGRINLTFRQFGYPDR